MTFTPEWAYDRAKQLVDESVGKPGWCEQYAASGSVRAFASYIAAHEEEPIDPLLIEARELCAAVNDQRGFPIYASQFREGAFDACHGPMMKVALAALRRGIELTKTNP